MNGYRAENREEQEQKKWISLYVENQIGVLAKISGLFSSKSYNLESLTVGPTDDTTVSRITICVKSNASTFEQIKKQLNRCIEVITVKDFTSVPVYIKELMLVKVKGCSYEKKAEVFKIAETYGISIVDYGVDSLLLECVLPEEENDRLIRLIQNMFNELEVVRGGSVAIEAL